MQVRGVIHSTETWTATGSGLTASDARAQVEVIPDGYTLEDVTTVSAKPGEPVTVRVIASSAQAREVEATGETYVQARDTLLGEVPDGWQLQSLVIVE